MNLLSSSLQFWPELYVNGNVSAVISEQHRLLFAWPKWLRVCSSCSRPGDEQEYDLIDDTVTWQLLLFTLGHVRH